MFYTIWIVFGVFFSTVSYFPLINSTHWIFRIFDFIRLQLSVILLLHLIVAPFLSGIISIIGLLTIVLITITFIYQLLIILPYLPRIKKNNTVLKRSIVVISINVKQENKDYEKLIRIVKNIKPDILLTMETDIKWEQNLEKIEGDFNTIIRVPKSNRYGMHLYTKLELKHAKVHHLISKKHPSIEVKLTDSEKNDFIFWGVHPPPPSPTEKPTSKQKDAELMKIAKQTRESTIPVIVSGDFNSVSWSKTSKLFSKISNLKDARINRGIYSTFPANLRGFGFPIDLLFHSNAVTVDKIKILSSIGSDHLPLLFMYHINNKEESDKKLNSNLKRLANQKILEGKEAAKDENG